MAPKTKKNRQFDILKFLNDPKQRWYKKMMSQVSKKLIRFQKEGKNK